MVSSVLAGFSGCWVDAVAHRGCGLPLWPSCFPGTKVFTPLVLGELTIHGKLSDVGQKALHVLFKMLDKNSQQASPVI